jgi:hypothetical protein
MEQNVPASVEIADSVIYQNLQDEVVILNMASGEYYGLDSVGASMWKMLIDQREIAAVADRMVTEYEVRPDTVRGDLHTLVRQLLDAGLLKSV